VPVNSLRLTLLALLPITIVLFAGCSDDDGNGEPTNSGELTVEEYFGEIEAVFQEASAATDELNDGLDEDLSSAKDFGGQLEALQTFLSGAATVFDDAVETMESIQAPVEVEQPHNDFTEGTKELAAATQGLSEDLDEAEDEAEAAELLQEFEGEAAEPLFAIDEACADLQDIADDNDIEADLKCTERVFPEGPDEPF
jgi:uncharacterized phage infection (PIP) family protein YhgE